MEAPRLERKLVAILAVDVEGYSRHMERDEAATLATLSRHRLIVDDLIARHSGRITGTAGGSVLAEFVSVVDAADCAVQVQRSIAAAMADERPERRMLFRIGINVGDVMVKDGDIFGDGVNIAARLEAGEQAFPRDDSLIHHQARQRASTKASLYPSGRNLQADVEGPGMKTAMGKHCQPGRRARPL